MPPTSQQNIAPEYYAGSWSPTALEHTNDMDAAEEERDVQLQRDSADLLLDFKTSLHPFLWSCKDGKQRVRRRVRVQETERLIALV